LPYQQKVLITYFDILGFRDLVSRSVDPEKVVEVLLAFRRLSEPPESEIETWDLIFSNFSDLAVRAIPIRSRPEFDGPQGLLFWELLDLAYIQANLIERNVFVRGAVTVGELYGHDGIVFGPALIRAYELESTVALYPRIIIDSRVFDRLDDTIELRSAGSGDAKLELSKVLAKDSDNVWFVDYLAAKQAELQDDSAFLAFIRRHKAVVVETSSRFHELDSRLVKMGWTINYHNRTVEALPDALFALYRAQREAFLITDEDVDIKGGSAAKPLGRSLL
jgi:hypothetical protein